MSLFDKINKRANADGSMTLSEWIEKHELDSDSVGINQVLSHPSVLSSVKAIAEILAMVPLNIYRERDGVPIKDTGSRLDRVFNLAPNFRMTSMVFRETLIARAALSGNAYAVIQRNSVGNPIALRLLPLDSVHPAVVGYSSYGEENFVYQVSTAGGTKTLAMSDVIHIQGFGIDGMEGLSVVSLFKKFWDTMRYIDDYESYWFRNGSRPGGILSVPGRLTDEQFERMRASWQESHGATKNAHKVAILDDGITYTPQQETPASSQLIQAKQNQREAIPQAFHIPPHTIGHLDRSTWGNIEHEGINYVKYSLLPWAVRIEQELTVKLIPESSQDNTYIKHNLEGIQRGDLLTRYNSYEKGIKNGWLTVNDILALEDKPLIGTEGDVHYLLKSMIPMGESSANETSPEV